MPDLSVDAFFADSPPPAVDIRREVQQFIAAQQTSQGSVRRPIVCVTSGGTTVPLERNCVRFIDNFSGGTRGALSTEEFLLAGYAVIFLNRKHSIQPFTKGLPSGEILECLPAIDSRQGSSHDGSHIVQQAIARATEARRQGTLLRLSFETVFEYLSYLREIATQLQAVGPSALFYLAAAVSDFYIPWSSLEEHKIQSSASGDTTFTLKLDKVPKMLGEMRQHWAPKAFITSFKLETDETLLIQKAWSSIKKYDVHAVVANILQTRKEQVLLVHAHDSDNGSSQDQGRLVSSIKRHPDQLYIERQLVACIVAMHTKFCSKQQQQQQ